MVEIIKTKDGSHTLYVPSLNEHYHSVNGAIQESMHVFIKAGLHEVNKNPLTIFEVGFGTGLNAYLTYLDLKKKNIKVGYYSIELNPLTLEIINKLNYANILSDEPDIFLELHNCSWDMQNKISDSFMLHKIHGNLIELSIETTFDLIYLDAFGPDVQPELWSETILKKLIYMLNPRGILTTYSAKGKIKRLFKNLGQKVETIPGPPGKREMTRVTKC